VVELPPDRTTVILPDLHAQRDYLLQVLAMKVDGSTVYERLAQGSINLLCLGDGMHSEQRNGARWLEAEQDFLRGTTRSPALEAEMVESLGLLKMVMDLKVAFPDHFFFVRGNHEDMDPARPYRKLTQVGESNLVKQWVLANLGPTFLKEWHQCEQSMPLIASGGSFVGSHSPPQDALTRAEIDSRSDRAFRACTWSDNTLWTPDGPEERAFSENCKLLKVTPARPWVVGHRKVEGALYRSQCGGRLIQINPLDSAPRIVILAPPRGQAFRPEKDVQVLRSGR
jgi:hypothetical protein